jgi:EAL domain-containing protein (putative c-di-GMP-specific phosphodiesterase class I)
VPPDHRIGNHLGLRPLAPLWGPMALLAALSAQRSVTLAVCAVQGLVFAGCILRGVRRNRPSRALGWYLWAAKMALLSLMTGVAIVRDRGWLDSDVLNVAVGTLALTGIGVAAVAYPILVGEDLFRPFQRLLWLWSLLASTFLVLVAWRLARLISMDQAITVRTVFDTRLITLALVIWVLPVVLTTVRNVREHCWAGVGVATFPLVLTAAFAPTVLGAPPEAAKTIALVGVSLAHALVAVASLHPTMTRLASSSARAATDARLAPWLWIVGFNLFAAPLVMGAARHPWIVSAYTTFVGLILMYHLARRSNATGRGGPRVDLVVGSAARPDLELAAELRAAMAIGQLELHYQPIRNLTDYTIVGVEALLRWPHPIDVWMSPEDVLSLARRTGLETELQDWILTTALRDAVPMLAALVAHRPYIAVNITPSQLVAPGFAMVLRRRLAAVGLDAAQLVLEITEHEPFGDLDAVGTAIRNLQALGIRLAIDDFGAGNANLALLAALEIDIVKLDRTVVAGLASARGQRIVATTVTMLHELGLVVVAEGIEDARAIEQLVAMHVVVGQGYELGRPLPLKSLMTGVSRRPTSAVRSARETLELAP